MPGLGRLSRRDKAKALPVLHARMELHLLNHAAFTQFCNKCGTDPAFAFADNRHLVSAANTTRRARPPSPTNSACAALPPEPPRRALRLPSLESHPAREETPTSQGQPVCDHLNPSSIEATESSQVEVAHDGVWGHPSPSLLAHLGCGTLKRNLTAFPKPLARSTPHECVRIRARAGGGVCTAGCGEVGPQSSSPGWWRARH